MINFDPKDEETNIAIVKRAFELGINFFDTAENYGGGEAEEALGRAFKALNLPRDQLVVSTKLINRVDGKGKNYSLFPRQPHQQSLDHQQKAHY